MEFGAILSMIHTCDQQRTVVWQQCHQTLWLSTALANVSRMEKDLPFYPHVHGWWLLIIYMYEVCFSVTLNPVTVNITLWFIVALRANTKWYMRLKVFNKPHSFRHTVHFRENMANKMCSDLKTLETSLLAGCVTSKNVSTVNVAPCISMLTVTYRKGWI